ncbi:MAG TPA: glycosyltransferase family 1 protein [Planctomycetota bacterium]|nr:glycosyltransferase family 1 protein [Planctomycetota bacterium]
MHVALGALCGVTGGPSTYALRLAEALAAREDVRLTVLTDRPERFSGVAVVEVRGGGGLGRIPWQHMRLPRALKTLRPDLYHDTKNALPRRLDVPGVVTVHDLAHLRCPETFGFASRLFLKWSTADAVKRARIVVVPSESTARDLAELLPASAGKVRVVPHGIAPLPAPLPDSLARMRARVKGPFVLHVGTIQARKNVDLLVRAVRLLRGEGLPHRLVLAGRRGWKGERAFAEIAKDDTALWLGEASEDDLAALHALADAFASPSGYEGFGFTAAEAMAAGVPVVASRNSSLPEVVGDAGVLLDALTPEAIAAALVPLLLDPERRRALGAAGRARAASFSWSRAAEGTVRAYRDALAA